MQIYVLLLFFKVFYNKIFSDKNSLNLNINWKIFDIWFLEIFSVGYQLVHCARKQCRLIYQNMVKK